MHRDDRPALVALALVLFAIISVAVVEGAFRNTASPPTNGQPMSSEFLFLGDSSAQWLMAAFTVIGTGISAWAVRLVNETLKTSRAATKAAVEALEVTRDIGERQLRPYIVFEQASFTTVGSGAESYIEVAANFRNSGLSPALITAVSCAVYAPTGGGVWERRGSSWQASHIFLGPNQTEQMRFKGVNQSPDGTYTWFTIGLLIWFEGHPGNKYESYVWLTFDGIELSQQYHTSGHTLYRPDDLDT